MGEPQSANLEHSVKINMRDKRTAALIRAASQGNDILVQQLLDRNADTEGKDNNYGGTPLLHAAINGRDVAVKLLLEKNADIEVKESKYGRTPLSYAAGNGHDAAVKLLLEQDVDIEAKGISGMDAALDCSRIRSRRNG